jgi:hypothetical protein
MTDNPQPSTRQWRRLINAAKSFRELEPWNLYEYEHLFQVYTSQSGGEPLWPDAQQAKHMNKILTLSSKEVVILQPPLNPLLSKEGQGWLG